MANCPNCGQRTSRTEDWACPWCGYPLLSPAYKKIPQTYQQLKAEKLAKPEPAELELVPEPETEELVEPEAEAMAESEVLPESETAPEPTTVPETEELVEPEAEVAPAPEVTSEPTDEATQEPTTEAEAPAEPEAELAPTPEVTPEPLPEPTPAPVSTAETTTEAEPTPEPTMIPEAEAPTEPEAPPKAEPEPAPEPVAEATPEASAEVIEVTVEELLYAYEADGTAADARFTNQTLKVTGLVDRTAVKDNLDIYYVILTAAETHLLQDVRCTFSRQYGEELSRLTPGQEVTVEGKYDGSIIDISLKDCVLVS